MPSALTAEPAFRDAGAGRFPVMPGGEAAEYDAVIVGAGPNGLAAAVTIAEAGRSVLLVEAAATVGGGTRSAELTLPHFVHDVCAAVHTFAAGSPFLRRLPLDRHGLHWAHPPTPLAHPLERAAAVLERTPGATARQLGDGGDEWFRVLGVAATSWDDLAPALLGPLVRVPRHPLALARFGLSALLPATTVARRLRTPEGRALFAGLAAHAFLPLESPLTASFGIALAAAGHAWGWPFAEGGSQRLADALAALLVDWGGRIETGRRVGHLDELPPAGAVLLDVTPAQLLALAAGRLPDHYRRRLERFRYGPAVFKVDYALDGPVPWSAEPCTRAGTLHLGGSLEEIAEGERAVARGRHPERPFMLVAQPTVADPGRAPPGRHVLWTYCHVPNGSTVNMTERMEAQLERFAPGFRERVLARHVMGPPDLERYDANYVGGDISGGAHAGTQLLLRPVPTLAPYRTPVPDVYLCSSSTPPGAGAHGMCGHWAARSALRHSLR